jgi:hypothetical protein
MIAMEAATGIQLILQYIGSIVTSAVAWITSYVGVVTASGNEFLLLFILIPMVGLGIGLLRRLLSLN